MMRTNAAIRADAARLPRSWRPGTKMQLTVRDVRRVEGTTPPFNQENTGGNYEGHAQDY
jgi:hypothetical protein